MRRRTRVFVVLLVVPLVGGCRRETEPSVPRASGYVEATDVRVASKVPGRVLSVAVDEGARVESGATLATLATADFDLGLRRARAERDHAAAQLRLVQSGAGPEDLKQAEAQLAAAMAEQRAAEAELTAARADEARFEQLLQNRAGSQKQRDDAMARRELADARAKAAADRAAAAMAVRDRLKAGPRPEEVAVARARVAAADAEIATLEHERGETTIVAPMAGIVASRLVEPGELVTAGTPILLLVDLDHAWASVYVEEPLVPALRLEQAATVVTDAGDRIPGRITFISPRAEFTPRNVQTAEERAKLVYRIKVAVDNRQGVLKPGMPVEVELNPLGR